MYTFFRDHYVEVDSGIKAPAHAGIKFHNSFAVHLSGNGGEKHVIDNTGAPVSGGHMLSYVCEWNGATDAGLMQLSTPDRDYGKIWDVLDKKKPAKRIIVRRVKIIHKKKNQEAPVTKTVIHVNVPHAVSTVLKHIDNALSAPSPKPAAPVVIKRKPQPPPVKSKEQINKEKDIRALDRMPFFNRMNQIANFHNSFLDDYNGVQDI